MTIYILPDFRGEGTMDERRVSEIKFLAEGTMDDYRANGARLRMPEEIVIGLQSAFCMGLASAFRSMSEGGCQDLHDHFLARSKQLVGST